MALGVHGRDDAESLQRAEAGMAVVRKIPPKMYARLSEGRLKSIVSHPDNRMVTRAWEEATGSPADPDEVAEGFYDPDNGTVVVNGADPAGVFAHEIGHALDWSQAGPGGYFQLSTTDDWKGIWRAELVRGRLTNYANTDPTEGLAEFARLVYADPNGTQMAQRYFPRAYAFFTKYGLV